MRFDIFVQNLLKYLTHCLTFTIVEENDFYQEDKKVNL